MESPSTAPATVPACFHHKGSGQAAVKLDGRFVYLGAFGSEEAQLRYRRVVAEWQASGGSAALPVVQVKHVIAGYWKHAEVYYRKNGKPTSELSVLKLAMRYLHQLLGAVPAVEFGPLALKACRERMIDAGLARTTINGYVSRIRQAFRWAVEGELVPGPVLQALQAVSGLKRGRSRAKECEPIRPVDRGAVDAVLPHVARQVVVGSDDERHLRAGTQVQTVEPWRRVIGYAAKYLAKETSDLPLAWQAGVGRCWGVHQRQNAPRERCKSS